MRTFICLLYFVLNFGVLQAQVNSAYYVSSKILNLRSAPDKSADIIKKLNKYDNLILQEEINASGWVNVKVGNISGYVFKKYIREGQAKVNFYSYRIGAVCKDGTNSSATGRGACSHHGGVSRWKTKKKSNVKIINPD